MTNQQDMQQKSGDNSTNIQAQTVTINGVTCAEARQIALDVFKSNALELAGIAKEVASSRAVQITEKFLSDIAKKNPDAIQSAADPDFQHSIFEAQKAFARSGDSSLEEILVNLLTERASEPLRNLKQVVLNEAIAIAAKLTSNHIDALTLIFRLRHTVRHGTLTLSHLARIIGDEMLPYCQGMPEGESTYRYLAYTGVATVEISQITFVDLIRHSYPGLCSKGVDEGVAQQLIIDDARLAQFFIPSEIDNTRKRFVLSTSVMVDQVLSPLGLAAETIEKVKAQLNANPMSNAEIIDVLINAQPKIKALADAWDNSAAKNTLLTPVGIAIAHANAVKGGTLVNAPLDIWVK